MNLGSLTWSITFLARRNLLPHLLACLGVDQVGVIFHIEVMHKHALLFLQRLFHVRRRREHQTPPALMLSFLGLFIKRPVEI